MQAPAVRQIIIDTDPGQDDAVAILLALASTDRLDVLALTTVAGNVGLEQVTCNARMICELAGRPDLPVYAGCDRPLRRTPIDAAHVHGPGGLDGVTLPAPRMPVEEMHAVDYLCQTLRAEPPGSVTLCMLGPLTNLATALARDPQIAGRIREVVLMGGARGPGGNVTPTAEFNIHADPDAAAMVFDAGLPLTVVPLDVTHQALVTPARCAAFRALGTPVGDAVAGLTDFPGRYNPEKYGGPGVPLHDPCVIAWLLAPQLFEGKRINIAVETAASLTLGMTVTDWWGSSGRPANALFLHQIDSAALFTLLTERLTRL